LQIKTNIASCHTADSKPVKQEVNGTVILPPLVFPDLSVPIVVCFKKMDCSHGFVFVLILILATETFLDKPGISVYLAYLAGPPGRLPTCLVLFIDKLALPVLVN